MKNLGANVYRAFQYSVSYFTEKITTGIPVETANYSHVKVKQC